MKTYFNLYVKNSLRIIHNLKDLNLDIYNSQEICRKIVNIIKRALKGMGEDYKD